jgi:flavin reductase (DIM6/NTAB) family NADH-FMN oxidoreductase RutF
MQKQVEITSIFTETIEKLKGPGVILLAGNPPNPMTIGWGTIGYIWGRMIFTALVRPSRFTFSLIDSATEFTVNLLPAEFESQVNLCGTTSGRDVDKIKKCGFDLEHGILIAAPYLKESFIHYECRIIHKSDLVPGTIDKAIIKKYYSEDDFHRVFFGEIIGAFKNPANWLTYESVDV